MIYMGNESDQTAGTTEEVYLDSFDKMIAAVNGFASDVTGKTESLPWFIYQFNSWKNRTPNTSYPTIPLALLKLARTRDDVAGTAYVHVRLLRYSAPSGLRLEDLRLSLWPGYRAGDADR
jgi:hypothetical protein